MTRKHPSQIGQKIPSPQKPLRTISSGKQPKIERRLSMRAVGSLVKRARPDLWGALRHPERIVNLFMWAFSESPHSVRLPPPEVGRYRSVDPALVEPILARSDPAFDNLCAFLGNAIGVWADYFPWSSVFAPMCFSRSYQHPVRLYKSKFLIFLASIIV